jgi:tetratricopeptide (TPR) repeat protein
MVCPQCGMRNLPDEEFCTRCGASLQAPPVEETPPESAEPSPEEARATEVRACLEKGDIKRAMDLAREAAAEQPQAALSHILLGDVYLRIDANDDALREYRLAVDADHKSVEAREKAEVARKRIVEPRAGQAGSPRVIAIGPLQIRRDLVPYIAGAAAALLVFCIGAVAIVSHASPGGQKGRSFEQLMALGSQYYRAGEYAEAAQAFEEAAKLRPSSDQAQRRLRDAQAMAGMRPATVGRQTGQEVAVLGPTTTPGRTALPPRWIGPMPGATPAQETSGDGRVVSPPPTIPAPNPTVPGSHPLELPPPIPPGIAEDDGGAPRGATPSTGIGASAEEWPTEPTLRDHETQPTEPRQAGGQIVIEKVPPRKVVPVPDTRPTASEAKESTGESLRAQADRLRRNGRLAEAARKYSEAATQLRLEAERSGPEAATKRAAATSCERAREACNSHLQAAPAPPS